MSVYKQAKLDQPSVLIHHIDTAELPFRQDNATLRNTHAPTSVKTTKVNTISSTFQWPEWAKTNLPRKHVRGIDIIAKWKTV